VLNGGSFRLSATTSLTVLLPTATFSRRTWSPTWLSSPADRGSAPLAGDAIEPFRNRVGRLRWAKKLVSTTISRPPGLSTRSSGGSRPDRRQMAWGRSVRRRQRRTRQRAGHWPGLAPGWRDASPPEAGVGSGAAYRATDRGRMDDSRLRPGLPAGGLGQKPTSRMLPPAGM